jgi:hypothetical protein
MTNLQRRLKKIEAYMTDTSGLVQHSRRWLEYGDRQMYDYITAVEPKLGVLFTVEAFRAVMKFTNDPTSLVGRIPAVDE